MIFRIIAGFTTSVIATVIPGWMAKLIIAKYRPIMMVLYQLFITMGIFINSVVMLIVIELYQLIFIYTILCNVVIIICTFIIKEE